MLQRVTGTKVWSVSEAVEAAAKGEFEVGENPIEAVHGVGGVVDGHFKELNPRAGLHEIMRVIYDVRPPFPSFPQPFNSVSRQY